MGRAVAISISLAFVSLFFTAAGWVMPYRLWPEPPRSQGLRWLGAWSIKGLLLPILLWALMNVGLSWTLQPFMPEVQAAQNSGAGWLPEFLRVLGIGFFIVSSYWTAGTLA